MYDKDNIFARIIRKEIPAKIVYESDAVLAFEDISAAAPTHILVIPKGEYSSFHDFTINAPADVISGFFKTINTITEQLGVHENGYRLITNHGADASQTVAHFHVHIMAGKPLGGLLPK